MRTRFNSIRQEISRIHFGSVVSICFFTCCVLWVWISYVNDIEQSKKNELMLTASIFEHTIHQSFRHEIFALEGVARDWQLNDGLPKQYWNDRALKLATHFDFQAVSWVEGSIVRWIVPLDGNEKAINLDLKFEETRRKAMNYSIATRKNSIGGPLQLVQGGTGIIVFSPIFKENECVGFINGVIKTEDHFKNIFFDFDTQYGISISADDTHLYGHNNHTDKVCTTRYVKIENFTFRVDIVYEPTIREYITSFIIVLFLVLFPGAIIQLTFKMKPEQDHAV